MKSPKIRVVAPIIWALVMLFFSCHRVSAQVVINEFYPKSEEWVEFYNTSESAVDLSSYYFDDDTDFASDLHSSAIKPLSGILPIHSVCYLSLSGYYLNDDGDSPTLFDSSGVNKDSYTYSVVTIGKTYSRKPDGGNWLENQDPTKSPVECISLLPQPTPTPTVAPTPTPTNAKATYQINDAKDSSGNVLSSVKIYIDGSYTGNYTHETYTFCDGCTCGTNKVACGFGNHNFRLEKSDYQDWKEDRNITSGNNYSVDPVMYKISSATPSPTPTATPTPTITPKQSIKPSPTASATGEAEDATIKPEILGLVAATDDVDDNQSTNAGKMKNKVPSFAYVFLFLGAIICGVGAFLFYRQKSIDENNPPPKIEN